MCLICYADNKAALPRENVSFAMKRNSDGWGFMYADPVTGRVVSQKGMGGENVFYDALASVPDNVPVAVHFRMATRGEKDASNAHPFKVLDRERDGQDVWLMHNGPQITRGCKGDKERSDTREFVECILRPMLQSRPRFLRTPTFRRVMEEMTTERVLILEGCGKVHVFNSDAWHKKDGVLYSNTYSLPQPEKPAWDQPWNRGYYGGMYYGDSAHDAFLLDDGWEQLKSGAWVRKGSGSIPSSASNAPRVRMDGAGRPIPDGQDRPSQCPNRNHALCRMGCKIGEACQAPLPKSARGNGRKKTMGFVPSVVDASMREREAKGKQLNLPSPWTCLHGASENEVFNLVVSDPEGCERYLVQEGVSFDPGLATRFPDTATDLVLDTLRGAAYQPWLQ